MFGNGFIQKLTLAISLVIFAGVIGNAQAFSEGFDVISPLPTGWSASNQSAVIGSTNWFQGNTAVFSAQTGAANSYIGANFNNAGGANTISNWLLTPNRTFSNGDVIKFWTRTVAAPAFADRLQVRLSLNGSGTNTGTGAAAVGDFTTLLLDINPTYRLNGYPETWTEHTITLSGLGIPTSGRLAFRYFVEDAGPIGNNSDYIGIDTFSYQPAGPTASTAILAGQVLTANGSPIRNVLLSITSNTGEIKYARTNSFGYYHFQDLEVGQTYILSISAKRYTFAKPIRLITLNEDLTSEDFIGDF